jgi:hypothetical protein
MGNEVEAGDPSEGVRVLAWGREEKTLKHPAVLSLGQSWGLRSPAMLLRFLF